MSPHLAARLAGQTIDLGSVVAELAGEPPADRWIVEGAGGVLVPINRHALMVDLMVALGLPVLVTSQTALGTINHTLLTLEALRARRLTIAGVLLVGNSQPGTRDAIAEYGDVPIIGEIPRFDPPAAGTLREWATSALDHDGRLAAYFA